MVIVTTGNAVTYDVADKEDTAEELVEFLLTNGDALDRSWLETDQGWIRADQIVHVEDREAT